MSGSTLAGARGAAPTPPPGAPPLAPPKVCDPRLSRRPDARTRSARPGSLLAPPQLGGSTSFVVVDGTSMLPRFHGSDLVALRPDVASGGRRRRRRIAARCSVVSFSTGSPRSRATATSSRATTTRSSIPDRPDALGDRRQALVPRSLGRSRDRVAPRAMGARGARRPPRARDRARRVGHAIASAGTSAGRHESGDEAAARRRHRCSPVLWCP